MKLFNHKNLLLLIGAQLLISIVLVEAGFFDQFNKNNKNKKNDVSQKQVTTPEDDSSARQEEGNKRRIPQHPRRAPVAPPVDEAAELAAELSKMDEPKVSNRPKRPQKFSNMLAAAKEQSRLENEQQEDGGEDEEPAPTKPKVKVHNILNKNKTNDNVEPEQQQESSSSSSSGAAVGGKRVRHPKPSSGVGVRTPGSSGTSKAPKHSHFNKAMNTLSDSKLMHAHFWKKELKDVYQVTKEKVKELPTVVKETSDSIAAMLKLDSRGRILAMIKEVDEDISFVRGEFSNFSITWSPIMEKALSYIGTKNLDKLRIDEKDELDFRKDALIASIFGFEFMKLMMAWRENLMIGHQAYREYLMQVLADLEKEKFEVKEDFMYQLETIHNYILLNCWQEIDNLSMESKMKLDYLMNLNDQRPKNYESEYFRDIVVFQEIYDPTVAEFKEEREQVINALTESGQTDESFNDVEEFFDDFKNNLVSHNDQGDVNTNEEVDEEKETTEINNSNDKNKFDWEVPKALEEFMKNIEGELRFNKAIYQKSFLKDLKEAKEKALNELYGTEENSE